MNHRRLIAAMAIAAVALPFGAAPAEPLSTWETYPGYDCTGDPFNPIDPETGLRDPNGDPEPGSEEWTQRDAEHVACTDQRDHDSRTNPMRNVGTAFYGEDMYRQPSRHDGVRFHFDHFNVLDIPDVPSTEVYRPCSNAPGDCPGLPAGLPRFDPPYPVVIVMHGVIAQNSHHRFNTQVFAEHGYMAVGVDGIGAGYAYLGSGPNSQRCENASDVLNWLGSEASGVFGEQADLSRVALAGHSQGAGCALGYQGDPRVHAIIAWDGGDSIAEDNCTGDNPCAPIMYQRTDGGFATPSERTDYPSNRDRGLATYASHTERGMDVFFFTARATVHTDWNGYGVGLAGNRYAELLFNYYNLAWLDRHLRGALVFDGGDVVTAGGRTEAEERAFRQAVAQSAFDRLTARFFDDSADVHNVSMGYWDPELAATSGDPLYGGNVPYAIEGLETRDRFSPYFYHYCSVSVPDYVGGSDGSPGSAVAHRADTGPTGDMRFIGCPPVS
ncbi:MAG TPA: hypothetical protein VGB83_06030 [Actinomycetota bacterium]